MLYLSSSQQGQRGAFSILAAGTLLMSLMFLVITLDSGRLYMEQRRLQKIADTAAIESISRIENGNCLTSPTDADLFARDNAARNSFLTDAKQSMNVSCVDLTSENGLIVVNKNKEGGTVEGRAVQVETYHEVPASLIIKAQSIFSSIPATVKLSASAVAAREEPSAVFSVGSQLLRLENNKLLGQVLTELGVKPEVLTLLDKDGLASVKITPAGLLKALGVNVGIHELKALSPQGLVNLVGTKVGLGISDLLDVGAEVIGNTAAVGLDLDLLRQGILSSPLIEDIRVNLLDYGDQPGLLTLDTHSTDPIGSALDTTINLGEILSTAIFIGVHEAGRGIVIPGLNLLGQTVELGIVEPPSLGIGPVGTTAYNAQIRLYIGVDTDNIHVLSLLLRILNTRVNLPIWIDLVSGHGTLDKISCDTETPTVDISVESKLLNVCIGKLEGNDKWSTSASCDSKLQSDELIKLLGISVLSGKSHIPAVTDTFYSEEHPELQNIKAGEKRSAPPSNLALGDTADAVVDGLLQLLSGLFQNPDMNKDKTDVKFVSDLEYEQKNLIEITAQQYLTASAIPESITSVLPEGIYSVENVIKLILEGSDEIINGEQVIPPLTEDWDIEKSMPTTCLLGACSSKYWTNGTFSSTFKAYSEPHGILDILGISTLDNGYKSCGGLLAMPGWNKCIKDNLVKILTDKPNGLNISPSSDIGFITGDNPSCSGLLCILLKPVITLLKPILNGVGLLLKVVLTDILGLEIGRTDVTVHSISCGAPRLVR